MEKTVLLTSFTTWKPHQVSNSSDDLLENLLHIGLPQGCHVLRQLPVDFQIAPEWAIAHINTLHPDVIICCGMAENRTKLSVESRAVTNSATLYTGVDLQGLTAELPHTEISHDAGRFVCNWLYFSLLNYIQTQTLNQHCLFVHVPILSSENRELITSDFQSLLGRILAL